MYDGTVAKVKEGKDGLEAEDRAGVKNERGLELGQKPGLVRERCEDPAALAGGKVGLGNGSSGYKNRGRWKGEPQQKVV
jgi:hypothetical protein